MRRLAALDSKKLADGPYLVAEADGDVIAALAIGSDHAVSDPFRWSIDVVELMKIRAAQLRAVPADAEVAPSGSGVAQLRTQLT